MNTRTSLIDQLCGRIVNHLPQDDGMDWPDDARELRGILDQASILPPWIHIGPYSDVDDHLQYLLAELRRADASSGHNSIISDELAPSFSSALRACNLVRLQYRQYRHDILSPDYSTALVYAIMSACSHIDRKLLLENDAWLAIPRIPGAHPAMHYACAPVQIPLAVAVCAGDVDIFDVHLPQDKSFEEGLLGDPAYVVNTSGEIPWSPHSVHVFRRWLPSTTSQICGHPFLCMATLPELKISMSAVLHQRCIWGLSHPVIGISLSPTSTEIAFILGWHDFDPQNPAFPSIHMCDLGPKLTFDLNHPRDTLAAYRTVLSLRGLARDLYNSANSRAYTLRQPFSALHQWRADTFNFLWPTEDTNSKISRWLEQSIPPTESEIMAEDLRRQLQDTTLKVKLATALSMVNDEGFGHLSEKERETVEKLSMLLKMDPSSSEDFAKFMEFSSQLSVSNGSMKSVTSTENWLINHWLLDRYSFTTSAAANRTHWNTLRRYTRIYWPKDLLAFDEQRQRWTLAADSGLTLQEEYLEDFEEIFSALSAYKAMHPELVYEFSLKDKAYPPDIDAAELEPYLRKALPMIIETYGMLRSISNKVDSRDAVNEATWRVPIDALHMNLFSNKKHAFRGELRNLTGWTSARVKADGNDQMERTLKLPLNLAYHRHLDQGDKHRVYWGLQLHDRIAEENRGVHLLRLVDRLAPLLGSNRKDDIPKEEMVVGPERASAVGGKMRAARDEEALKDSANARELLDEVHVLYRAALLGSTAVADAMAYVRLPVQIPKDRLNKFALSSISSKSATDEQQLALPPERTSASGDIVQGSRQEGMKDEPKSPGGTREITHNKPDPLLADIDASHWDPDLEFAAQTSEERNPPLPIGTNYLHLPVLIAEWKKQEGDVRQAVNQHYVNHTSAARFLEACGIVNFPIFGMMSNGPVITLDYAYTGNNIRPSEFDEPDMERPVLICDRHGIKFDLLKPMGIWRIATTIISLNRLHVPRLMEEWQSAEEQFRKLPTSGPDDPRWLHGWDLHKEGKLPEWTVPQSDVRTEIEERVKQLRAKYEENPPPRAHVLERLAKVEKIVKTRTNSPSGTGGRKAGQRASPVQE